ncbi:hypothetical protein [Paraperlucidibaca sp.]|uniref:hypothetical protein n=1 Tax=Paraperlucidibaca sp. TaxID=2708021 RepID=UPI0030F44C6A
MSISDILNKVRDPYDLKARVAPGLWVLFPLMITAACLVGPKHPLLTAILSLAGACGGPYLLSNLIRTWGVKAQNKLYERWDGKPTTILLRHRDNTIASISKQHYHKLITQKLEIAIPSAADEAASPEAADHAYRAAVDQLISQTRDTKKFPLLFKELIGYGFNRNMYGARRVGVSTCVITIVLVLAHAGVIGLSTMTLDQAKIEVLNLGEWLTIGISCMLLLLWLFHFSASTVRSAGDSYAIRLLECLHKVKAPTMQQLKKTTQ